jgi:hypothetical protein
MTIAEIKGKISRSGRNLSERLEDLLTSDVFSACRYTNPNTVLAPFLNHAKRLDNKLLGHLLNKKINNAYYVFWPQLPRCEPDVLIAIEFLPKQFFIILVEIKYFSSKSCEALRQEELIIAETPRDQLAREYSDLLDKKISKNFEIPILESNIIGKALVYITAHRSLPQESIEESVYEAKRFVHEKEDIDIFWLSWFELYSIISQMKNCKDWEKPIIEDLKGLLERKQLVKFHGFQLAAVNVIVKNSIYKHQIKSSFINYIFKLVPIATNISTRFYFSDKSNRIYNWSVEDKKLSNNIYNGGLS